MVHVKLLVFLVAVLVSLGACSNGSGGGAGAGGACSGDCDDDGGGSGGEDDSGQEAEPTSREVAAFTGSSAVNASYDAGSGIFTVTLVGSEIQLARFSVADHGDMLAMRDALGIHNAYFGEGRGTEVVVYSGGLAGSVEQVAGFTRTAGTSLPLSGSARFHGEYAGFTTTRRVNGQVRLDVDFEGGTVEGRITDREFRQRPDNVLDGVNPLSALRLEQTRLNEDGTFAGETGGGQIVNGQQQWNPATGDYAGLLGGTDGEEAVGTMTITHHAPSGASFEEVGGFIATR